MEGVRLTVHPQLERIAVIESLKHETKEWRLWRGPVIDATFSQLLFFIDVVNPANI